MCSMSVTCLCRCLSVSLHLEGHQVQSASGLSVCLFVRLHLEEGHQVQSVSGLSVYLSVCLSFYLSLCLSTCLSGGLCTCLHLEEGHQVKSVSFYLPVCPSVCLSSYLPVHLSACLAGSLSVYSPYPSLCLEICLWHLLAVRNLFDLFDIRVLFLVILARSQPLLGFVQHQHLKHKPYISKVV